MNWNLALSYSKGIFSQHSWAEKKSCVITCSDDLMLSALLNKISLTWLYCWYWVFNLFSAENHFTLTLITYVPASFSEDLAWHTVYFPMGISIVNWIKMKTCKHIQKCSKVPVIFVLLYLMNLKRNWFHINMLLFYIFVSMNKSHEKTKTKMC